VYKQLSFWGPYPAKTIVILLSGKAGSGKTTFSKFLVDIISSKKYSAYGISLSAWVKAAAESFFFWDGKKDERGRKLLIDLTNIGHQYDEYTWVKHFSKFLCRNPAIDFIVIDDFRYMDDVERIKSLVDVQLFKVKIERPIDQVIDDKSEKEFDLVEPGFFDVVVNNTGNLDDFSLCAKQLVENIIGGYDGHN
jgi:molybdopterin-guanine dinucleotide biosynthesis protein